MEILLVVIVLAIVVTFFCVLDDTIIKNEMKGR